MIRILLVGSGLTSAITGSLLRHELPRAELVVWDKARGVGGRMSTIRNTKDDSTTVDLGAQYITTTRDYAELHSSYYKELEEAGILKPLAAKVDGMRSHPEGTLHYVFPMGSSSLVKYYLNKGKLDTRLEYHVENISSSAGKQWEVLTVKGEKEQFDVVILSIPIPQILNLKGQIKEIIEGNGTLLSNLKSVDYSSRYALGLFFKMGEAVKLNGDHCAQYIASDSVIRFVALDHLKRGRDDSAPSVVVHTSAPFGKANEEKSPDELESFLVDKIQRMFPHWPKPDSIKCHKWRYSQVTSAFPGLPGAVPIGEGLIVGGDGFTHSNMDGCIESAKAVAAAVLNYVSSRQ